MAVTSTNILRKGSTGKDVLDLQRRLNSTGYGYNLAEDGNFGDKTLAAVKDYQKRSGLTVDGFVGTDTWGALTNAASGGGSAQTPASTAPTKPTAPTFDYKESDAVTQANALLQQYIANKPGEWQGGEWSDNLNKTIAQILNRDKFSYDLNKDMLYQQYKDQYTTQGKLASMDVMGQVASMTGGYGNSYAQTAGQQAYQAYLQQLNDVVPELYGMARDQYNQEGQDLYNQASLMAQMDEQEYGRYRDKVNDYYAELNRLTENARYMSETEYKKALDDFNIKYGAYRDDVSDKRTAKSELISRIASTGYVPSQAELEAAGMRFDEADAIRNQYLWEKGAEGRTQGRNDAVARAEMLAAGGDYSALADLYGMTEEQVAAAYAAQNVKESPEWPLISEWDELMRNAKSAEEAEKIANNIIDAGYPDTAYRLYEEYWSQGGIRRSDEL